MATVLIPLPDRDFDVTEVAVPWKLLTQAGHRVVFATERGGAAPACDPLLLTGVIFGQLGAEPEACAFYRDMESSPEFKNPVAWTAVDPATIDGLILPGGHAKGMRPYLESPTLQQKVAAFWKTGRPVGAICHGTIVLARTRDPETGKSVLARKQTTCLPRYMEWNAWTITRWKMGDYYRTYPQYVEEEVRSVLEDPDKQFVRGPYVLSRRGTATDDVAAFCVQDGLYLSARWPGDAYLFARNFAKMLAESSRIVTTPGAPLQPPG